MADRAIRIGGARHDPPHDPELLASHLLIEAL